PMTDTATGCLPLCAVDADCPSDRKCEPARGMCVKTHNTGDPTGTACDVKGSKCAGMCLYFGSSAAPTSQVCTNPCVLGRPEACNPAKGALSGTENGLCWYTTQSASA